MMDANFLYKRSSDDLMRARLSQSQISQQEFELRLTEINNKYTPYNNVINPYGIQKYIIESEINRLKSNRDNYILEAIHSAIQLANIELYNNSVFSMAYLAISSINSFLTSEKISSLSLPFTLQSNISQLYLQLTTSNKNPSLTIELQRLKETFNI